MTTPRDRSLIERALTAYRERVLHFCTRYAEANGLTLDDVIYGPYWPTITQQEAAFLADEGPEAYLRYVGHNDWVDRTSIEAEVDYAIMRLLNEDTPPPSENGGAPC